MRNFTYHEPETVEEAVSLLGEFGSDAKIKAGGTDLLVSMKRGTISPKDLINLKNLGQISYIDHVPRVGLRIGAMTTLREMEDSPIIRKRFNVLRQAASKVASPHIRSRATLGGNVCLDSRCEYYNQSHQWFRHLNPCTKRGGNTCHVSKKRGKCHSIFSADTAAALIALKARLKLVSSKGERAVPLESFYTGVGTKVNKTQADEIVTEIQIPEMPEQASGTYVKVSERNEIDFPIIGIAVVTVLNGDDCFESVDVIVIGTGPGPIRLSKIGEILRGEKPNSKTVEAACKDVPGMVRPISNMSGLAEYKSRILASHVAQGIIEAVCSAGAGA